MGASGKGGGIKVRRCFTSAQGVLHGRAIRAAADPAREVATFGVNTDQAGAPLKVRAAHPVSKSSPGIGQRTVHDGFPAVGTAAGLLVLDKVQPAGKKAMPGDVFLRGANEW